MCTEICGDGFNIGLVECDDGNMIDGDGCSSNCTIEAGWVCSDGTPTSKDNCQFICGNGVLDTNEECDDGNILI